MRLLLIALAVAVATAACAPGVAPGGSESVPAYEREALSVGWADLGGSHCRTRQEILQRDLVDEQLDHDGCKVLSGTLHDTYTGTTIAFFGGPNDQRRRADRPRDPARCCVAGRRLAVERRPARGVRERPGRARRRRRPTNNAKHDRGPSRWLPPNGAAHCAYATSWRDVADAYGLTLLPADTAAIERLLDRC